ncbi:MAG: NAD(P)-dependent oxidoreductase [Sideroxydans sp. GWF2_59_14]|nr:MAG: NAD(P)-dependent oxidoreductase [Sideroxydans sp. GWF2_59_14]HAF43955.1 NAD(P)-dependent oxidoreductase [Gallionellaceae bacterium]
MKRLLIIGCGDIARRTIPLLAGHYRLYALVRNATRSTGLREQGVTPVIGDLDSRKQLSKIAGLADVVLHLAPPPNTGTGDNRTRHLLAALSQGTLPKRLIYISTSGVYGDSGGAYVDETRPVRPRTARAQRRVDAEQQIRRWARRNGVHATILRVPGIYAAERLPLERIRSSTPALDAAEDGYTNHIHADDLARIIVAALQRGKPNRVYHASGDGEMKMGDYFDIVADAYRLPRPPRISRAEAQRVLPESLLSFVNESRRLVNGRMKRELGVRLRYSTVMDLLK